MHPTRRTLTLAVLLVLAPLVAGCSAKSAATPQSLLHMEAENHAADAGKCNGEATVGIEALTKLDPKFPAGSAALRFPGTGCWSEWSVTLVSEGKMRLVSGTQGTSSANTAECIVWGVSLDGARLGGTAPQCAKPGTWNWPDRQVVHYLDANAATIPKGPHMLRITLTVVEGPSTLTGYLDYFEFA